MLQTHAKSQKKYCEKYSQKYGKEAIKEKSQKRGKKTEYQVGSTERKSEKIKKQTKCSKEITFK